MEKGQEGWPFQQKNVLSGWSASLREGLNSVMEASSGIQLGAESSVSRPNFLIFRLSVWSRGFIHPETDMVGLSHALRFSLTVLLAAPVLELSAQSIVSEEVASREASASGALPLLKEGDVAYRGGDFKGATEKYRQAVAALPLNAAVVSDLRKVAVQRFAQAAVEQARDLGRTGDYPGANQLLDDVSELRPDDERAAKVRQQLLDPMRANPALSPEHAANVDRVRRELFTAEGYLNQGQFDRALLSYEDVLRIDPYNRAARRGMEKVHFHQSEYQGAAYDQARAQMLMQVDRAWETKVPEVEAVVFDSGLTTGPSPQISLALEKLRTIQIPNLDLEDASLEETLDYLQALSVQNDQTTLNADERGVSFVVQLENIDQAVLDKIRARPLSVQLRNVTLEQALKVVTESSGTQYRVDEFAVVVTPIGAENNIFLTRTFRVPPDFLTTSSLNAQGESEDPFADEKDREGSLLAKKVTAKDRLISLGVAFPEGSSATYLGSTGSLTVRNTATNLDYVAAVVDKLAETEPVQVVLRTTILDITQRNLEELGFDWLLSDFGSKYQMGGGTTGSGRQIADGISANPVTAGLRSGPQVVLRSGLEAALNRPRRESATGNFSSDIFGAGSATLSQPSPDRGPSSAPSPLSVRGIVDDGVFQAIMRGLSQKGGTDVMTRPEVITRSGQNAVIKSVREFWYPTEYEPPELPNSSTGATTAVTPATPTAFTSTDLGVTLEVLPQVSQDRTYVDVTINPQLKEFEGFINYGSPITGQSGNTVDFILINQGGNIVGGGTAGNVSIGEITPNDILMPLFRTIRTSTTVTVADGATIVVGGLVTESRQKIEDKVPILGDLPFVGRLFQTDAVESQKRNLLILLNVELQDPSGRPYRNR